MATLESLTATTTINDPDIFYTVLDPSGTPLDRKITKSSLSASLYASFKPSILNSIVCYLGEVVTFNGNVVFI